MSYGALLLEIDPDPERIRRFEPGRWTDASGISKPLSELTDEHLGNIDRMLKRTLAFFSSRHTAIGAPEAVVRAVIRIRSKLTEIDLELDRRSPGRAKPARTSS